MKTVLVCRIQHNARMGAAGPSCLHLSGHGGEPEDGPEDESVGCCDEHPGHKEGGGKPEPDVGGDVDAGQAGDAPMLIVDVWDDTVPTERQPQEEECGWEHRAEALG